MVEIKYLNSEAGLPNCFDLLFNFRDYVPEKFWNENRCSELDFYIDLFRQSDSFECSGHGMLLIWSQHYTCSYLNIPFTLVFDEDYDICSFSISPEYISHRYKVAEEIKKLIMKQKKSI